MEWLLRLRLLALGILLRLIVIDMTHYRKDLLMMKIKVADFAVKAAFEVSEVKVAADNPSLSHGHL